MTYEERYIHELKRELDLNLFWIKLMLGILFILIVGVIYCLSIKNYLMLTLSCITGLLLLIKILICIFDTFEIKLKIKNFNNK